MNTMNRKWSRCWGPTSGRIFLLIGLFLAFATATGAETFSGYGSGSDNDYGEACRLASEDYHACDGTVTFGDCDCKKEEPDQDYYWSCSIKWTCTIPSQSDDDDSDEQDKKNKSDS